MNVDQLIRSLILGNCYATEIEIQQLVAHVGQCPVASYPVKITQWLRQALADRGFQVTSAKRPSVEVHLLKRIYFDGQWPVGTIPAQFEADLHQAVQHPDAQILTYRRLGEYYAGFLAPSHVGQAPDLKPYIFVA